MTPEDINRGLAAGFTLFTIDPGAHVNAPATTLSGAGLQQALDALPWAELEDSHAAVRRRFLGRREMTMEHGPRIREDRALDFVALGALVHRLDPGVVPFRKATERQIHVGQRITGRRRAEGRAAS